MARIQRDISPWRLLKIVREKRQISVYDLAKEIGVAVDYPRFISPLKWLVDNRKVRISVGLSRGMVCNIIQEVSERVAKRNQV